MPDAAHRDDRVVELLRQLVSASAQLRDRNIPRAGHVLSAVDVGRAHIEHERWRVAFEGGAQIFYFAGVMRVSGVLDEGAEELLLRAGLASLRTAGTTGTDFGKMPFEGRCGT